MKRFLMIFIVFGITYLAGCSNTKIENNTNDETELNPGSPQEKSEITLKVGSLPSDLSSDFGYIIFQYVDLENINNMIFNMYYINENKWVKEELINDEIVENGYLYYTYKNKELHYGYTDYYDMESLLYVEYVYDSNSIGNTISSGSVIQLSTQKVKINREIPLYYYISADKSYGYEDIDTNTSIEALQGIFLTVTFKTN